MSVEIEVVPLCRVKCFYQGCLYGLSLESRMLTSRASLAEALRPALHPEESISPNDLQIVVLDSEVRISGGLT